MSLSVESAQSKWLAQLESMRTAIAELKLDQVPFDVQAYGHDLPYDDDFSGGSSSDDIWDLNSNNEDDQYSSDLPDGHEEDYTNGHSNGVEYSNEWLRAKAVAFSGRRSGLNADDLQEQILALLGSDSKGFFPMY